jgi:hypothetical protein
MAGKYDQGMLEFGNSRILRASKPQLLHRDATHGFDISHQTLLVDRGLSWEDIEKVLLRLRLFTLTDRL